MVVSEHYWWWLWWWWYTATISGHEQSGNDNTATTCTQHDKCDNTSSLCSSQQLFVAIVCSTIISKLYEELALHSDEKVGMDCYNQVPGSQQRQKWQQQPTKY